MSAPEQVACPNCLSADRLVEQSFRYTFQPVTGLQRDGGADDYDSFDYGDDVIVLGYSCECGWYDATEVNPGELQNIAAHVDKVLSAMPKATAEAAEEGAEGSYNRIVGGP